MTRHCLDPIAPVTVPVAGSARPFHVRRVYCVGRNYAEHAREMGSDPDREPPFFFCKPADAVWAVMPGTVGDMPYPTMTHNLHYEVELVVAIGVGGRAIAPGEATKHIFGYAVGLDMTRRDLQSALRDRGRPWEVGKAFDYSAPIAPIVERDDLGGPDGPGARSIALDVNGAPKQRGDLGELIWSIADVIANLSTLFALEPGDLIFTGTPAGVGPVVVGDLMEGSITGLPGLCVRVAPPIDAIGERTAAP